MYSLLQLQPPSLPLDEIDTRDLRLEVPRLKGLEIRNQHGPFLMST